MPRGAPSQHTVQHEIWPNWTPWAEVAVATLLAVIVALEVRPGWSVGARVALAAIPPLVWLSCAGSREPPFPLRAVIIIAAVGALVFHPAAFDAAPFFLVLLIGEAAAVARPWQSVVVVVACSALLIALDVAGRFHGSLIWLLAFAFTWSGMALLQSRLRLVDQIGERAAVEERQRIARELHDVIAHSLAVTMLHLTGARLALERDPDDAARALAEAERLGRQSLGEIRQTIGLLSPGDEAATAALPAAADIPELVRTVSDAGLCVKFVCTGDLARVPPTTGLTLYRVAQESLANVVKHASGADALLCVAVVDGHARVDVRNVLTSAHVRGRGDGGGLGLKLMRERTELLGGTLYAGPDRDEWHVSVDLPLSPRP